MPGFAIGSALGGDPIGLLTGAVVAAPVDPRDAPTHVGFGARFALDVPAGDITVDAHARVDLARLRLVAGAPEPARPATAAGIAVTARRTGGWLVGAEVAGIRGTTYAFVGSERGDAVLVYDLRDERRPRLLQVLPTGDAPEGLLAVPNRQLFLTSNEDDGTISVFGLTR